MISDYDNDRDTRYVFIKNITGCWGYLRSLQCSTLLTPWTSAGKWGKDLCSWRKCLLPCWWSSPDPQWQCVLFRPYRVFQSGLLARVGRCWTGILSFVSSFCCKWCSCSPHLPGRIGLACRSKKGRLLRNWQKSRLIFQKGAFLSIFVPKCSEELRIIPIFLSWRTSFWWVWTAHQVELVLKGAERTSLSTRFRLKQKIITL